MHVSWFEADAYARWRGARLPTEAEWEHAAALFEPERGALDQLAFGPGPAGPVRGRLLGVDRERVRRLPGLRGLPLRRVLRGLLRRRLPGAARRLVGHAAARGAGRRFRNWDHPAAAPDLRRLPLREERVMSVVIERREVHDTLADDVRDGLTRVAQGAAAEVLLRRARIGAVRPHHHAARVLPDALRARDPQPPRARDRRGDRRRGAGRAGLGHGVEDARAALRDGRPRLAAALRAVRRGRVGGRGLRATSSRELYPGPRPSTAWWATSAATSTASPPASGACSRSSAARSATCSPTERADFLARLRELMGPEDRLVIGTDLVKDRSVLEAAYNDSAGVTAEFNRNVLRVINAGLGRTSTPRPSSTWPSSTRPTPGSRCACAPTAPRRVRIHGADLEVRFADGEEIRTEISAKFTREAVERELRRRRAAARRVLHRRLAAVRPGAGPRSHRGGG